MKNLEDFSFQKNEFSFEIPTKTNEEKGDDFF